MSDRDHVEFLDRYYSRVHRVYDLTRKYYLLGRDALLREISTQNPRRVVEVGCGTGRNLAILKRRLPAADFGAVEPCESMRSHALKRHPWIEMSDRVVEAADLHGLLPHPPDVIFFSYSLSMVEDKTRALSRCLQALGPHGRLYVLDFGDLGGLGRAGRHLFSRWLNTFHVFPEQLDDIWAQADSIALGPRSYWKRGHFRAPPAVLSAQEMATASLSGKLQTP